MSDRNILLNPGPVTLSAGVRKALTRGDWCHRESEFADLTRRLNARIVDVYRADHDRYAAVILTGSGTGAVEAMLATLAPTETATLVAANGVYGERMAAMLEEHGRPVRVIRGKWAEAIDFAQLEAALREDANITHVAAVHHETTTGRLNDIERLGALCKQYDKALLLDSVSSFGAELIRFDEWNLAGLAATANKCLHGAPGMSFVVARREALAGDPGGAGTVYLDLKRYYATQHLDGFSPFTLAVQIAFALDAALDEFFAAGGWRARQSRYRQVAGEIASFLSGLGIETLLPSDQYSATMYSYVLPSNVDYQSLHDGLKSEGFVIYAGQGNLSGSVFRIAHMGAISDADIDALKHALGRHIGSVAA